MSSERLKVSESSENSENSENSESSENPESSEAPKTQFIIIGTFEHRKISQIASNCPIPRQTRYNTAVNS